MPMTGGASRSHNTFSEVPTEPLNYKTPATLVPVWVGGGGYSCVCVVSTRGNGFNPLGIKSTKISALITTHQGT